MLVSSSALCGGQEDGSRQSARPRLYLLSVCPLFDSQCCRCSGFRCVGWSRKFTGTACDSTGRADPACRVSRCPCCGSLITRDGCVSRLGLDPVRRMSPTLCVARVLLRNAPEMRMAQRSARVVLTSLKASTYRSEYASAFRSLRPCWTNLFVILLLTRSIRHE